MGRKHKKGNPFAARKRELREVRQNRRINN